MLKYNLKLLITVLILSVGSAVNLAAQTAVGFDQVTLYNQSNRPLKVSLWYPSETTFPLEKVADNPAFLGTDVVRIGSPLKGEFPLVVISHGYRGNWRNQNWLATRLTQQGFIVASLDHPGTSSFDHAAHFAAQWWERPKDLSRLIDWLLGGSYLTSFIDHSNITAIGHSLGGWTVMALAGAKFDRMQLINECQIKKNPRVCGLMPELGLDKRQLGEPVTSLKDDRIKQVVSLDLGLARSFSRQSLMHVKVPTLILAAGVDIGNLPQADESGFIAQYLPKMMQDYKVYPDATHFSFMQLCKPGAIEMIEQEEPGDSIVCKDGGQRSREQLHEIIYQDILGFIRSR